MNAYEIAIWRSAAHNGVFSHNMSRVELIHARNKEEAERKFTLSNGYTKVLEGFTLEVSNEVVYSIRKIGTVSIKRFYVYSDGRSPVLVGK